MLALPPLPPQNRTPSPAIAARTPAAPGPAARVAKLPARTHTHTRSAAPHAKRAAARPLAGKVVGVDPGHNGHNWSDPSYIDHQIWNGRQWENCNTTGTQTDGGYTEALFNWNVGTDLAADLRAEGARVVLTRHNNHGVGPCVNARARILNSAHVDVAVAIHADGGPVGGRGFTVLEPVADGINNRAIKPSRRFASVLRNEFRAGTGMPVSTYDGTDGLQPRNDLAGENLTKVPYALIECGNMRNRTDAAMLVTTSFQKRAARAIAKGITAFLTRRS